MKVSFVADIKYTDIANTISRAAAYNAVLELDFNIYLILDLVLGTLCMPRDYIDEFLAATENVDLATSFANMLDLFYSSLDAILDDQATDIVVQDINRTDSEEVLHAKGGVNRDHDFNEKVSQTYQISTAFAEYVINTLRSNFPNDLFYLADYHITDAKKFKFGGPYYITAEIEFARKSVPNFRPIRDHLSSSKLSTL